MRKPRDYDAELQALTEKARGLKERKVRKLGELIVATGADALPLELLAGVLLAAVETRDMNVKEGWRTRGSAFFQGTRQSCRRAVSDKTGVTTNDSGAASD
jgi:hypothetical protein